MRAQRGASSSFQKPAVREFGGISIMGRYTRDVTTDRSSSRHRSQKCSRNAPFPPETMGQMRLGQSA